MGYFTQRIVSALQKLAVTGCTPKATEGPQITQQVNKCFLWLQTKNYTVHPTHPPCTDALLTSVFMWISVGLASSGHMRPLSVTTQGRHGRGRKEQLSLWLGSFGLGPAAKKSVCKAWEYIFNSFSGTKSG